ncbi:uncharacterized protein RCO7_00326 [Rhynchosporium graminicola]|uniref:Uncharacterized protein n=1 Tax=Rhynchosporium graminicola TaxID=2792576 RepID=A0A1E1KGS6_9HELO|nr:uncharacterized protein RCO7_00326 [Rhynchosporium commune]
MATHDPTQIFPTSYSLETLVIEDYSLDTGSLSAHSSLVVPNLIQSSPVYPQLRQNDQNDMWVKEHHDRAQAVKNHMKWLQEQVISDHQKRNIWLPSTNIRDGYLNRDIQWGVSTPPEGPVDLFATHNSTTPWDEENSQTFDYARDLQDKYWNAHAFNMNSDPTSPEGYVNNLTHVELDVEGIDANGCRVRAQRILEVNLKVYQNRNVIPATEETTMEFKRTLVLKSPAPCSLLLPKPRDREPYYAILAQLAQHEVDKALDERNHYLREVFGLEVDHVRTRREGQFGEFEKGEHSWNYQRPEIGIKGQDGTMMHLVERRSDADVAGEVILTHIVSVMQVRCGGRSHLFDLPTEGSDEERRIRKARWSVSSAIDRCVAAESPDRVVLDKRVDGTFLPRQ